MSKFLMCLQEFTVQAVIVSHIVSHVIKCEELDKNRMKMAFWSSQQFAAHRIQFS